MEEQKKVSQEAKKDNMSVWERKGCFGEKIFEKDSDHILYAKLIENGDNLSLKIDIYLKKQSGAFFHIWEMKYSDLSIYSGCMNFLENIEGDFGEQDKEDVWKNLNELRQGLLKTKTVVGNELSVQEIPEQLIAYIIKKDAESTETDEKPVFVEEGYGFILTSFIPQALEELGWNGYSRKKIEAILEKFQILVCNTGRHDYQKRKKQSKEPPKRYWKILLDPEKIPGCDSEEKEGETCP